MQFHERSIEPGVVTTAQAAQYLRCNPKTVRKLCRQGDIRAVKLGTDWRIPKEALEEFVDGHATGDER